MRVLELVFEASKLVLFARKQTKRSEKIGVFQESGSKKYHQLILGNHNSVEKDEKKKSENRKILE